MWWPCGGRSVVAGSGGASVFYFSLMKSSKNHGPGTRSVIFRRGAEVAKVT